MSFFYTLLIFITILTFPVSGLAQAPGGTGNVNAGASFGDAATISELNGVMASFISAAIGLVAVAVAVMVLVGGFKYLTAGADKEANAKAQHTLTYALIGLTLVVSAGIILTLVSQFLGVPSLLNFNICLPGQNC
jgi:hypothetical protein